MYGKIIFNIILIISLAILQLSFFNALPGWLSGFNAAIVAIIFILGLGSFGLAFWWAIGLGIFFDVYSFAPFGFYLFSLVGMVVVTNFLLVNFLTNRSLYSFLVLTIFAFSSYRIFLYILNYLFKFFGTNNLDLTVNMNFWFNELKSLSVDLFAVFVVFYLVNFMSKKLKPVFLIR